MYRTMGSLVEGLFPQDTMEMILFKSPTFQAIGRVYKALARDERIRDIYDAEWHCLGKVIATLSESDEYDLLQGSPIGYMAKDAFPDLAKSLQTDTVNVRTTEPVVKGPAVIVATLAIFA